MPNYRTVKPASEPTGMELVQLVIEASYHCGWSAGHTQSVLADHQAAGRIGPITDDEILRRYDLFANNVAALARADALRRCAVTAVPDPAYVSCYGDLFSWEEFVGSVACRALIDYDGYGVWSDGMFVSDRPFTPGERAFYFDDMHATHYPPVIRPVVLPSRLVKGTLVRPAWATHVLWFNK